MTVKSALRWSPAFTLITAAVCCSAHPAQQTQNVTIQLPAGSVTYPDTHTICTPAAPTDIILFFLTNYLAHAVTVRSLPGEGPVYAAVKAIVALLCPSFGFVRALDAIFRHGRVGRSPLDRATRSGALCIVARDKATWRPRVGEKIRDAICVMKQPKPGIESTEDEPRTRIPTITDATPWLQDLAMLWPLARGRDRYPVPSAVFGTHRLPEGYCFMVVPHDACVQRFKKDEPSDQALQSDNVTLISSYSWSKPVVAIMQIVFAAVTLWQSRGGQLAEFGYAAYSFSVVPYLFMSMINFLACLATPDYPCLYMVRTDIMGEAEARGGYFESVVGTLDCDEDASGWHLAEATWLPADDSEKPQQRVSLNRDGSPHVRDREQNAATTVSKPAETDSDIKASVHSTTVAVTAGEDSAATTGSDSSSECFNLTESFVDTSQYTDEWSPPPVWEFLFVPIASRYKRRHRVPNMSNDYQTQYWAPFDTIGFHGKWLMGLSMMAIDFSVPAVTILVIGAVSHFKAGHSTIAQRVWLLVWICITNVSGSDGDSLLRGLARPRSRYELIKYILGFGILLATPAIGMLAMVGQQLVASGTCTSLG